MVSKLEIILGIAILFFATKSIYTVNRQAETVLSEQSKIMVLQQAKLYEVNQTAVQHIISAAKMVQYTDQTYFSDFKLFTPKLILRASNALLREGVVILDENATIIKANGMQFYAKTAQYDKRSKILLLSEDFAIRDRFGDLNGSHMQYDAPKGLLKAGKIHAIYEMK